LEGHTHTTKTPSFSPTRSSQSDDCRLRVPLTQTPELSPSASLTTLLPAPTWSPLPFGLPFSPLPADCGTKPVSSPWSWSQSSPTPNRSRFFTVFNLTSGDSPLPEGMSDSPPSLSSSPSFSSPTNFKLRILTIFCSPSSSPHLHLLQEVRLILQCLKKSKYRDQIQIDTLHAATVDDVVEALSKVSYDFIYFSGHGVEWNEYQLMALVMLEYLKEYKIDLRNDENAKKELKTKIPEAVFLLEQNLPAKVSLTFPPVQVTLTASLLAEAGFAFGGLAFESYLTGTARPFSSQPYLCPPLSLARLISSPPSPHRPPFCVILNACHTYLQGELLRQGGIPFVICAPMGGGKINGGKITDSASTQFSLGFYESFFDGSTVATAFDAGNRRIELKSLPNQGQLILLQRGADSSAAAESELSLSRLREKKEQMEQMEREKVWLYRYDQQQQQLAFNRNLMLSGIILWLYSNSNRNGTGVGSIRRNTISSSSISIEPLEMGSDSDETDKLKSTEFEETGRSIIFTEWCESDRLNFTRVLESGGQKYCQDNQWSREQNEFDLLPNGSQPAPPSTTHITAVSDVTSHELGESNRLNQPD